MTRGALPVAALAFGLGLPSAATLVVPSVAAAQVDAFRYDPTRVPVGRLYEYVKSNRDGTHSSPISLYVLEDDRIESLKWSPDDTTATLVAAVLDWDRFSVRRFESWSLAGGAEPELRATLRRIPRVRESGYRSSPTSSSRFRPGPGTATTSTSPAWA